MLWDMLIIHPTQCTEHALRSMPYGARLMELVDLGEFTTEDSELSLCIYHPSNK